VDDLEPVAGLDLDGGPDGSGGDFAVVLDGDAVAFEFEGLDQVAEFDRGGPLGEAALASVDLDVQGRPPLPFQRSIRGRYGFVRGQRRLSGPRPWPMVGAERMASVT
jgi:hypothetical protein